MSLDTCRRLRGSPCGLRRRGRSRASPDRVSAAGDAVAPGQLPERRRLPATAPGQTGAPALRAEGSVVAELFRRQLRRGAAGRRQGVCCQPEVGNMTSPIPPRPEKTGLPGVLVID